MKLDDLTPLQRECYDNWNSADFQGGSCQEIGRAWAAFSPSIDGVVPGVILVEDYLGFVNGETYETDYAFDAQVKQYQMEDIDFHECDTKCLWVEDDTAPCDHERTRMDDGISSCLDCGDRIDIDAEDGYETF